MGLARLPEPSPGDVFPDLEGASVRPEGGREFLWCVHARSLRGLVGDGRSGGEARVRGGDGPDPVGVAVRRRHARLSLQSLRTHRVQEAGRPARDAGRSAGSVAARRALRGPVPVARRPCAAAWRAIRSSSSSSTTPSHEGWRCPTSRSRYSPELALEAQMPEAISHEIRKAVVTTRMTAAPPRRCATGFERLRADAMSEGADIPRPATPDGDPSAKVSALQQQVEQLRRRLLDQLPPEAIQPNHPDHGRWLLAHHRLAPARGECGLVGLSGWWSSRTRRSSTNARRSPGSGSSTFDAVVHKTTGRPTGSVDPEISPAAGDRDREAGNVVLESGEHYGTIEAHDRAARTIDLKSKSACHPTAVFSKDVVNQDQPQKSVIRPRGTALQEVTRMRPRSCWSGDRLGWRMAPLRSRSVRRRPTWRCVSSRTCARPRWLSRGRAPARRSPARAWCWRWSAGKKVDHRDRSQGDRQPLHRSARAGRPRASICGWAANLAIARTPRTRRSSCFGTTMRRSRRPVGQHPGVRRHGMAVAGGGDTSGRCAVRR